MAEREGEAQGDAGAGGNRLPGGSPFFAAGSFPSIYFSCPNIFIKCTLAPYFLYYLFSHDNTLIFV